MDNEDFSTPSTRGQMSMEDANESEEWGKYYEPANFNDFHVGFRYYSTSLTGGEDYQLNEVKEFWQLQDLGFYEKVVVKYLDREDIEELGWEYHASERRIKGPKVHVDYYYFFGKGGDVFQLSKSDQYIKIVAKGLTKEKNMTLFRGSISNYNELKFLMKQLGIKR